MKAVVGQVREDVVSQSFRSDLDNEDAQSHIVLGFFGQDQRTVIYTDNDNRQPSLSA